MKYIFTFFILLLVASSAHSQYSWTQKNNFPGAKRYAATTCVVNDRVFFGLGSNGNNSNSFSDWWEYDPATDVWTQKADFAGGGRYVATSMAIAGKAYVGIGVPYVGSTIPQDWWEYDPITDTWNQKNDFPSAGRYGTATFVIDDKGYMCAGNEGSAYGPLTKELWQYDPSADMWTLKTPMPGIARYGCVGFAINGKGYAGMGGLKHSDGSYAFFKDIYQYDPVDDSWTQKADYPKRKGYPVSFVLNGKAYVGVGNRQGTITPEIDSYDPASDSWEYATIFPGGGRFVATGFSVNGKAYVGLGAGIDLSIYYHDIWEYGPPQKGVTSTEGANDCSMTFLMGSNQLVLHINNDDAEIHQFVLYDLNSKVVQSKIITDASPIDLNSSLPKGIYFAVLQTQDGVSICRKKIIVQ